jgi:MFS family permease
VLTALLLVTALASFESTVVSTAMPTIIGDLHGLPLYSWVFSLYLLSATVMMPLFGSLADLYGRRRVLLAALGLFLLGALCCAAARTMPQLIAARALQGLGAAGLVPVSLTVLADLYELRERPRVQGWFSAIWAAAALLGPLVGAWLTLSFGWRSIFSITLPLGLVSLVLVVTQMRETRASSPVPFDYAGAVLLSVSVTALLFATLHGERRTSGLWRGALLLVALGALLLLVRAQARAEHPLLPPSLFTRAATGAPYLAGVLLGTTIYGIDTFVPLFVQGALGGTATAAGAVVTPVILMWALSANLAARSILGRGFRRTARIGALVIVAGFALLLFAVRLRWPVAAISAACGFIGTGLGFSSLSQILAVQHEVAERERGVATSLVPFMRSMGGAVGVGALGGILSAGLTRRLGDAAAEAGQLLAGRHAEAAAAGVAPQALREALGASLLPIFDLLAALSLLNLLATSFFPESDAR